MADYTVSISLPDHKRGDRWIGISRIGPVLIDDETPAEPLTRVRMQFRRVRGTGVFTIDTQGTPDAPAVIDDAETWEAHIPAIDSFLPHAGNWVWDMEFYRTGHTAPLTLYKGTLVVHPDVTLATA